MQHEHHYSLSAQWMGNTGQGTRTVKSYERSHTVSIAGKPDQHLTTDNPLVGDRSKLNPEDLLVTAVASCHMLSYLYVCAMEGVVVTAYTDNVTGIMVEKDGGGGQFKSVTLNPEVQVSDASMVEKAKQLHHRAHEICYIANSVNFPVEIHPLPVTVGSVTGPQATPHP